MNYIRAATCSNAISLFQFENIISFVKKHNNDKNTIMPPTSQTLIIISSFSFSKLEKPTDVKIVTDKSALTAIVSWRLPKDDTVNLIKIELREKEVKQKVFSSYIRMPSSYYKIEEHLKICREYVVDLSFIYRNLNVSDKVSHEFGLSGLYVL